MRAAAPSTGRYEVLESLGSGVWTTIHRGRLRGDEGFERPVALKRLRMSAAAELRRVEAFVEEAKIGASFGHPNLVETIALEADSDRPFIAMELVDGEDLAALLARSPRPSIPVWWSVHVAMEILAALDHMHEGRAGRLVHGDVSPQNILLAANGEVKLSDFGATHTSGLVRALAAPGRAEYQAPERRSGPPDTRADVFSVGVVLWELLAGRRLFAADDPDVLAERLARAARPAPSSFNRDVTPALDALVLAALEADPEQRVPSALALRQHLGAVLDALHGTVRRREVVAVLDALRGACASKSAPSVEEAPSPGIDRAFESAFGGPPPRAADAARDALAREAPRPEATPRDPDAIPTARIPTPPRGFFAPRPAQDSETAYSVIKRRPIVASTEAPSDDLALLEALLCGPASAREPSVWVRDQHFNEVGPMTLAGALEHLARMSQTGRCSAVVSNDRVRWARFDRVLNALGGPFTNCPPMNDARPAQGLARTLETQRPTGTIVAMRATLEGIETAILEVVDGTLGRDVGPQAWLLACAQVLQTALFDATGLPEVIEAAWTDPTSAPTASASWARFERARDLLLARRAERVRAWTAGSYGVTPAARVDTASPRV